jgi:hypothetical protein
LAVLPARLFPGEPLRVSWEVPHRPLYDSIAIRIIFSFGNNKMLSEPIWRCKVPQEQASISIPHISAPGSYELAYYIGFDCPKGYESAALSWCTALRTTFTVLAYDTIPRTPTDPLSAQRWAINILPIVPVVHIGGSDPCIPLLLEVHTYDRRTLGEVELPFCDDDHLRLEIHPDNDDETIEPHFHDVPAAPLLSKDWLEGGRKHESKHVEAFKLLSLLEPGSDRSAFRLNDNVAEALARHLPNVCKAEHSGGALCGSRYLVVILPRRCTAPGRYAISYFSKSAEAIRVSNCCC